MVLAPLSPEDYLRTQWDFMIAWWWLWLPLLVVLLGRMFYDLWKDQ